MTQGPDTIEKLGELYGTFYQTRKLLFETEATMIPQSVQSISLRLHVGQNPTLTHFHNCVLQILTYILHRWLVQWTTWTAPRPAIEAQMQVYQSYNERTHVILTLALETLVSLEFYDKAHNNKGIDPHLFFIKSFCDFFNVLLHL